MDLSQSREPTPGDVVITPDSRRWRVSKVDPGFSPGFIALNLEKPEVLTASVTQLEWCKTDECWLLVERRHDPQRHDP